MTTGSPGALPASPGPTAPGSAGTRRGALALPASTSFRFALLIAAVLASSIMVYGGIYSATPRGPALQELILTCHAHAMSPAPHGIFAIARADARARACEAGAERVEGVWVLAGIGVLALLAGVLYGAQPWWYRRRLRLSPLTGAALAGRLEDLRSRAGTGPVTWLQQPWNLHLSAFAFGRFRRRYVAISGGAVVAAVRQPAAFDAVVLHELAHIKNRDIDQTYLALAIWRAFVVAVLLPMAWLLIFSRVLGPPQHVLWRAAALGLIVYLLRDSIVRSREFDADARVREIDPDTSLGTVLADLPPPRRRAWHLGRFHPSGRERAAALLNPAPLYRCGFWDGLTVGLVAAIGAAAAQEMVFLLITVNPTGSLLPGAIFALFCGPALAVAIWRMRFGEPETAAGRGWPAGLGLGLGLALGPVVTLSAALDQSVAPDSLSLRTAGALAMWLALITFLFLSFPVWIGHWADWWQRPGGRAGAPVPARGGLLVAAVGAWVVLSAGLGLIQRSYLTVSNGGSARGVANDLIQSFMFAAGVDQSAQSRVVPLVFFAVPLSALLAGLRRPRAGGAAVRASWLRQARPGALLCVAGALTAAAAALAVAAVARAHTAAPVRWDPLFLGSLQIYDFQVAAAAAVVFAVIATAALRSARAETMALAVAAVAGAAGGLVAANIAPISYCVTPLSILYARPPASLCQNLYGGSYLAQSVLSVSAEAVVISLLFVPAAHSAGRALAIRRRRERSRMTPLWWLAAGAVAVAVIGGSVLRAAQASAPGTPVLGSIGNDGWVRGPGYDVRLFPGWYDTTPAGNRGRMVAVNAVYPTARLDILAFPASVAAPLDGLLRKQGARPVLLDGMRGLHVRRPGQAGNAVQEWSIAHGRFVYLVQVTEPAGYSHYLSHSVGAMLRSWHPATDG